jgi:hypothetical protein
MQCKQERASRDAIVPVIEKQVKNCPTFYSPFLIALAEGKKTPIEMILATPRQLCEALLRAMGKWKD